MADDASTVVVLIALELERRAVADHLTDLSVEEHPGGTLFDVGRLAGTPHRVVVAITGAGNMPAAALAERAIARYRPSWLLFVGVAGAWHSDIELGDVVVATKIYAYQGGREGNSGFLPRPRVWFAPHRLEQYARRVARNVVWDAVHTTAANRPPVVHFRPIAAGDVVVSSHDGNTANILVRHYEDATAVEMEAAGVAEAGHLNDAVPVLIIRGISDRADAEKERLDRAGWQETAAGNAAAFATALLRTLAARPKIRTPAGSPRRRIRRLALGAGSGDWPSAAGSERPFSVSCTDSTGWASRRSTRGRRSTSSTCQLWAAACCSTPRSRPSS